MSPFLSNILLTDWDRELEKRGHAFCRYADDCNIYVRSEAAGKRVMVAMKVFLEARLKLQVNAAKSACARPWKRTFLGYTLTYAGGRIRLRGHVSIPRAGRSSIGGVSTGLIVNHDKLNALVFRSEPVAATKQVATTCLANASSSKSANEAAARSLALR